MQLYILASGSTGNAMVVASDKTAILIDAGLGPRQLSSRLKQTPIHPSRIAACLITHEHSDHVRGLAKTVGRMEIPVVCNYATWNAITAAAPLLAPMPHVVLPTSHSTVIGDIEVQSFATSHDAVEPVGYRFCHGRSQLVIATDLGVVTPGVLAALRDADEIVLEANHDLEMLQAGPYPYFLKRRVAGDHGHLSNADAARALGSVMTSRTKRIHLAHLSQENNYPALAYSTVRDHLREIGAWGRQLQLQIAPPLVERRSGLVAVGEQLPL
ncbi:MAG: MBL fold metallo-hydrolase [Bacillota bacterium]